MANFNLDTSVSYAGQKLPESKVQYLAPTVDLINNPAWVEVIASDNTSFIMPADVEVSINGTKIIEKNQILDGVVVYDHVRRGPYEIGFDFTIRSQDATGNFINVFPQDLVNLLWQQIFITDSALKVKNTYMSGLGLFEIIVAAVELETVLGSTVVRAKITAYENEQGKNLIIT